MSVHLQAYPGIKQTTFPSLLTEVELHHQLFLEAGQMVKMPQRQRHNTGGGTGGADLPLLDPGVIEAHNSVTTSRCCVPLTSGCAKNYEPISLDSPSGCVRVVCNNEQCTIGTLMHRECFTLWEQNVLAYLRSCGRARSWSEKQRLQNLWTKRGYDLAYRACTCLCGRGHIRKDLDWSAPTQVEEDNKKKKKKNRQNNRPALVTVGSGAANHVQVAANTTSNQNSTSPNSCNNNTNNVSNGQPCQRHRASSISSTGSSPPSDGPHSPHHQVGKRRSKEQLMGERNRHGSGGGIFARRPDFSSFNVLPKSKINSYHIKMEDDGYHGNDETRCFILSTLAAQRTSRTACVLCHLSLLVFDRYPLLDGTFFLSPVQQAKSAIPVTVDGRQQYLTAVCMGCLEGWGVRLRCPYCRTPWDGSSLILGTMYSYDIFAAMPCCEERLKCKRCNSLVIPTDQRLPFFSDYSRVHACPSCGHIDYHFVTPLSAFCHEEKHTW